MPRISRIAHTWALLAALVCAALPAFAQEQQQEAPPVQAEAEEAVAQEPPPPPGIRQASIPTRADEVAATLRRLQEGIEESDYLERLWALAEADTQSLLTLEREVDLADSVAVSAARISDLQFAQARMHRGITERAADVEREWTDLRGELSRLREVREVWEQTRQRAINEEFPPELTQRVEETIAGIDTSIERLDAINAEAASLADRLSRQNERAIEIADHLEAMELELAAGLLDREPGRLFSILEPPEAGLVDEFTEASAYWWRTLVEFGSRQVAGFYMLGAIFLGLVLLNLALHRWSRSWPPDDPVLQSARGVVGRPVAMSLAFTAVLFRTVFPDPVRATQDAMVLVAVFALLRLGHKLLHPSLHRGLRAFVLIYAVNVPWQILPSDSFLGQRLLAIGIVTAIVAVAYVLVGWKAAREPLGERWWRISWLGLWLAEFGFIASFAIGALGWIRLTRFLHGAFVVAVFGAIAWRVIYKTAVAVLPFLIRAPLAHVREGSRRQEPLLRRVAAGLVALFVMYRYLVLVLENFRMLVPARQWIAETLSATYEWGGLRLSLGTTLSAVLILILTPFVARTVRFILREEIGPRLGLPAGVDYSLETLAGYIVWVLGIAGAASTAGITGTQMTVLFGALGVGLGFGLQAVVNNFVSGLILMFERPLKVGDRVQTATHAGVVTNIGIRASNIRTFSGADVVVPNGDLITKEVINWTLSDDIRRIEVKVSTSYGSKPRRVLDVLNRIAAEHPEVLEEPAPAAVMHSFGDTALNFELRAWVEAPAFVRVGSELHVLAEEGLTDAGIELVVPRRELLIQKSEPAEDPED